MARRIRSEEQGAMMVIVALSLLALLGLAGLVIDGGRAYAAHRSVQNAADAAALAGAGALNRVLFDSVGREGEVWAAVLGSLTANDVNGAADCRLVDEAGSDLGACPETSTGAGLPATAAGVAVIARDAREGYFIQVLGIEGFSTSAPAAAQVQALRSASSPFMVCGLDAAHGGFDPPLLLEGGGGWAVNPAALNQTYPIHGPAVPACGAGSSSFKGLVADDASYAAPGWWPGDTGVHAGPLRSRLARPDACTTTDGFDSWSGCTVLVPLCVAGQGTGTGADLYCVSFGAFRVFQSQANAHEATFLGAALVQGGQGGGRPAPNEARLIKLTR